MVAAGRSKSLMTGKKWQRSIWGGSSSRGTGEPCLGDTGELSDAISTQQCSVSAICNKAASRIYFLKQLNRSSVECGP